VSDLVSVRESAFRQNQLLKGKPTENNNTTFDATSLENAMKKVREFMK
jgi:hypothetical protein